MSLWWAYEIGSGTLITQCGGLSDYDLMGKNKHTNKHENKL